MPSPATGKIACLNHSCCYLQCSSGSRDSGTHGRSCRERTTPRRWTCSSSIRSTPRSCAGSASRHRLRFAPELAFAPRELRRALYNVGQRSCRRRSRSTPRRSISRRCCAPSAASAPAPRTSTSRRASGASVEVVRSLTASARAEAEFVIGAMLSMLRRVPVRGRRRLGRRPRARRRDGRPGRHAAGGAHDRPAARRLRRPHPRLRPGAARDRPVWADWQVEPLPACARWSSAPTCCACSSTTSAATTACSATGSCATASRTRCVVSTAHSRLFDEVALATALTSGRIAAAWLDSVEPGALDPHRPLHGIETLQVTPRVAATTRESRSAAPGRWRGGSTSCSRRRRRRRPTSSRRFQARSLISKPIRLSP